MIKISYLYKVAYGLTGAVLATALGVAIPLGVVGTDNDKKENVIKAKERQLRVSRGGVKPPQTTLINQSYNPTNPPAYGN